jgi:hypothetical protein
MLKVFVLEIYLGAVAEAEGRGRDRYRQIKACAIM